MQKGDAAISVATATGNTKALCNFTYGIFGLFPALTHTLLPRTRRGAMSCASNPAALSSQPCPAQSSPSLLLPLHGAGSWQPCSAQTTSAGLSLVSPGQSQAGTRRGDPSSVGLIGPAGGGWHMPGLYKTFCNEECVERLKQFRDVSKPFSTEPGLAGTSQCLHRGPGPAGAPCPSAEHLSQQARPGNGTGAPRPLYLSDLTLYLRTR